MTINGAQLLKQLEPAVRPGGAPSGAVRSTPPLESQGFDQLLSLASRHAVHSGRQVSANFDPAPPLSAEQLERLASAADQAEAAGAKRSLMLIDGRGFVLDVNSRTLVAELKGNSATAIENVDAAVCVGGHEDSLLSDAPVLKPPSAGVNPVLSASRLHHSSGQMTQQSN